VYSFCLIFVCLGRDDFGVPHGNTAHLLDAFAVQEVHRLGRLEDGPRGRHGVSPHWPPHFPHQILQVTHLLLKRILYTHDTLLRYSTLSPTCVNLSSFLSLFLSVFHALTPSILCLTVLLRYISQAIVLLLRSDRVRAPIEFSKRDWSDWQFGHSVWSHLWPPDLLCLHLYFR